MAPLPATVLGAAIDQDVAAEPDDFPTLLDVQLERTAGRAMLRTSMGRDFRGVVTEALHRTAWLPRLHHGLLVR